MIDLVALPEAGDWLLLFLVPVGLGALWGFQRYYSTLDRLVAGCILFLSAAFISAFSWGDIIGKMVLGAVHWVLWLKAAAWTALGLVTLAYILGLLAEEVDDEEM